MIRLRLFRFFKSDCDKVQHIRMGRTLESTIFEIASLFIIIVTWVVAVLMYRHAPETIPTHFDLNGNPNNEGSRMVILFIAGISTILTLGMTACAYVPTYVVNPPTKLKTPRQYILAGRMVRIIALVTGLLFISTILMMGYPESPWPRYLLIAAIGMIIVVTIIFTILIARARKA